MPARPVLTAQPIAGFHRDDQFLRPRQGQGALTLPWTSSWMKPSLVIAAGLSMNG
jgi:hypothetical protein